jgi:hypothetical protein
MWNFGFPLFNPIEYQAFTKNLVAAEKGLEELELAAFGVFHPELGACFVEKWWLVSKQVVSSIRRYHGPLSSSKTYSHVSRFINGANQNANNHKIRKGISL